MASSSEKCAEKLYEIVPPVMQLLRHEMRAAVQGRLSITQFRVLARLRKKPACSGELADEIGVSLPAMSRMIDGLARRGLVARTRKAADRRQITLKLTSPGRKFYDQVKARAKKSMARQVAELTESQKNVLLESLNYLSHAFLNLEDSHENGACVPFGAVAASYRMRP